MDFSQESKDKANELSNQLRYAYALREEKANSEALAIAKNCLKQFPNNSDVYCLLGVLEMDNKNYLEAEKSFNMAILNGALPDRDSDPSESKFISRSR